MQFQFMAQPLDYVINGDDIRDHRRFFGCIKLKSHTQLKLHETWKRAKGILFAYFKTFENTRIHGMKLKR